MSGVSRVIEVLPVFAGIAAEHLPEIGGRGLEALGTRRLARQPGLAAGLPHLQTLRLQLLPAVIGALDHFAAEVQLCRFVKLDDFGHGETTRCSDDPFSRAQRFCPPGGGQVAASGSAATLSDCQ